ncbi:MAG: RNB domain-containing ribonuclease [Lachnospiraceae bacterium]|nr:RNB domain-containing ribonuclease [Lachnospiraceae bacterium]
MSNYAEKKKRLLQVINDKHYKPLKQKELAFLLQIPQEEREEFRGLLAELVKEGKVLLTKRGKYKSLSEVTKIGTFTGHAKGFGFVTVEGEEEDYFISEYLTNGALHNDKVMIKIINAPQGRRKEAEIVRVIERGNSEIVGYYQKNKSFGFVIPDNQKISDDIFISKKDSMGAVTGHKVVVKLTRFGDKQHKPEGKVIEILGHVNDPGTDILSIARAFNLPTEFPENVMDSLERIPDSVTESEADERLDLRDWKTVTIDGEDAKDLDDAITLTRSTDGFRLGVHIADVTHYVREHSPLDKEALKRGTSVYLVDRVIPMLPHKLSNGICSLNAGEDRLALSCIMDIDYSGKVTGHQIAETIIHVDRRMSYNQVDAILKVNAIRCGTIYDGVNYKEKVNVITKESVDLSIQDIQLRLNDGSEISGEAILDEYKDYVDYFTDMHELSNILRTKRMKRGSIDFDFPESKILLTAEGEPVEIGPYDRNAAHKIIEDFMLMANETIAEDYFWQEIPFEYRTHGTPDEEKVQKLSAMIANFGYYFKASTDSIHPKEFQKLLKRIEGTPEEGFISRMTLRTMQQAKYSTDCSGHFGLATKYYCHFTSPIRRYPDLQIHRIIKENLQGRLDEKRLSHYSGILGQVADSNSQNERRAQEAEREVEKLKKVQYMSKRIGKTYEGIISGVTGYGFYVELPNTVEGMVRIASIPDDFYIFQEENMSIVGKDTGQSYAMGQKVQVKVVHVDKLMRTIDFEVVQPEIMEVSYDEKELIDRYTNM